jgi:aconitate hydratase
VLLKAKGKCTTDHISPGGPVAAVPRPPRQHLGQPVHRRRQRLHRRARHGQERAHGERVSLPPKVARAYKATGIRWVVVGDENYGEGSSREHAAMEPRHLGGGP